MDFSQFDLTDPFVRRALAETLAEDNGLDYQDEYIRKALNDEIAAAAAPKPIDGERNFFGDTVSRLARGGVQLADTAIHAVDTAVGGSETLQGWSDSLDKAKQNVGLLRPDKSEREEGWLKRSYGQALESAPMSAVPWAGAMAGAKAGAALGTTVFPGVGTAAGTVAGGLIGGAVSMAGLFFLGTYGQRKEEIERELTATRPDLTPDQISKMAHDNAKNHAFAETGGESAGDLASWAILSKVPGGQAIFKGGKAILAELVKPNAFKAIALGVGKSMPFEVGSEVGTAIWQNEADKAIGVEQGTSTDAALAAIGPALFLSAGMGVAVGGYSANQRRVQYNALNSEDQQARAQAVDQVAGTLAEATDQQTAKKWRDMALGFVQNGQPIPLDMNLAELSANEPEVAAPEAQDQPAETILKAESVDEAIQEAEAEIAKPGWLAPTAPDLEETAWLQQGVAAKAYNQGRNELGATPVSRAGLLGQAMEPMQVAAPADPLTEVLTTISTADQPTLLQMADGLPGLVEGSPELAPYQRQLSEAISKRQRILWEESNVGRGKVSGNQGTVAAVQPEQPAGVRDTEPVSEDSGQLGDGEGGAGVEQASPLLTAARQHVADTGDMTMGGLMKALDVDIDTAEALFEQVKATTPLPRNIGGTQAATVGADTGGFLTDQAIRKTGATSPATTAGDAQGFIVDQSMRKAAGAVTAAPVADTEGFVRDRQIRRDAMGRVDKPTRREGESARAFLARKREWEKGEAKPLAEEMFSAANKITGGGAANPFVLSKKGQVEVMSRAAKEIDPRLNTDERFHDALTSVGAVGRLPVRSANRKLASAFSSILSYRLDPESGRLEMAAALRGDEDEMARLVDKNALVRMRRNEDNSEDYELTSLGKKLLARFGEIGAVALAEKNISVSSREENETQAELPRTDETQAGAGGTGEMKKLVASIKKSDAKLEKLHEGQLNRMKNGGQSRATSTTYAARAGNEAKHRDGEARVLANIARAELRAGRAVPQDVLDILGSKIEYNRSGDYEPIEGVTAPSPGEASPSPAAQPSASKATLDELEAVVAQKRARVERTLAATKKGTKAQKESANREYLFAKKELQGWEQVLEDVRAEQQPPTTPAQDRTPEKPAGAATSGQRQEQAAKEPWQMTREEYLADALERNEYRDQYKANPKLLPPFEENTEREWRRSVEKAAETNRIPDAVLDSYLEKFGKQVFSSTFRGVAEKGVLGYFYPEIRAEQKAAPADKKTAAYDLKPHERTWAQQRGEERKAMGRMLTKAEWKELREQHKSAVQKALWNGEKVPASVLADYPELADAKTKNTRREDGRDAEDRRERVVGNDQLHGATAGAKAEPTSIRPADRADDAQKTGGNAGGVLAGGVTFKSREDAELKREFAIDHIATIRAKGQQPRQQMHDIVAAADEYLATGSVSEGVAGEQVFGHPQATNILQAKYGNLIPIKVKDRSAVERRIDAAQALFDEVAQDIGQTRFDASKGNKRAKLALKSASFREKEMVMELLRDETMPALNRLLKQFPEDAKPRKDADMADVAETDFGKQPAQPAQAEAASGERGEEVAPIPEFAQRAGVKTWQQATKAGLRGVIANAKAMADEVVKVAANWIYSDPETFADRIAEQIVYQTKLAGGRDAALRALENQYASKAQGRGSFEPGEKERYEALSRGFSGLRGERPKVAEAAPVEPEAIPEQRLFDTGFLREFRDRWQYKLAGNNGWFTADRKEDAVERARKAYEKTPEPDRLTAQERFDKSTAEQNADIERLYGDNSLPELRKEYARMEREIASLQKAGRREFDGNGGRRTGAAVSNEGARNIGEQKLKLGRYIEDREKAEKESAPTRLHTVSGYPSDNATKKHMLEAIAEARKELPEPSPKDGFSNAERIDWPKQTTARGRKTLVLPGRFLLRGDTDGRWRLLKDRNNLEDEEHGPKFYSLQAAKLWAEYYLLGKTEPSGPPHVFRGKNKEYEYTIPNSAYALDNFEKKVKGSSGVKFAKALPPSARADIPGELTQAFGKLRARVLMRKITVLGSQEEIKALAAKLSPDGMYSEDGTIIQAFAHNGHVYMAADGVEKGHVVRTLKHEFAHIARLGLRGTKPWQALLRSVDERMNEDSATGKALREARKKVPADTDAALIAEETLAYAVELSPEVGLVRRAIAMIKRFLVNMGVSPNIFTVEDWSALAAATLRGQARVAMGEQIAYSVRESIQQAKAFFSKLQQVSDDKFGGMKAQSVEPFLLKQGVKKTEIEATGLREWLAAMKPTDKVTKEQLRDFVRANTVEFEDVVLGGEEASFTPEELAQYEHLEELEAEGRLTPEEREMLGNMRWMEPVPQFPEYTEPGAVTGSYREMFVTAPKQRVQKDKARGMYAVIGADGEEIVRWAGKNKEEIEAEVESRRAGFPVYRGATVIEVESPSTHLSDWQDGHSQYSEIKNPIVRIRFNETTGPNGERILRVEEMQGPSTGNQESMPQYLRDNIYQTGVKRILAYAKENGFDGVALATKPGRTAGETQADRYSLEKQVDTIIYSDNLDGTYEFRVYPVGDEFPAISEDNAGLDRIEALAGKDVAKMVKNGDGTRDDEWGDGYKLLTGVDLRLVGGSGLKQLYDTDLPNIFKAWGGAKMQDVGGMPYIPVDKAASSYPMFSVRFEADEAEIVERVTNKYDIFPGARAFLTPEYTLVRDPAGKRAFDAARKRATNKHEFGNWILDGTTPRDAWDEESQGDYADHYTGTNQTFLNAMNALNEAEYKQTNDYLTDADKPGAKPFRVRHIKGFEVRTPDGTFVGFAKDKPATYGLKIRHHRMNYGEKSDVLMVDYKTDPIDKWIVFDGRSPVGRFDEEAKAIQTMMDKEGEKLAGKGFSEKSVGAVRVWREMTNRAFDLEVSELRKIEAQRAAMGLPPLEFDMVDETKRWAIKDKQGNPVATYEFKEDAELHLRELAKYKEGFAHVKITRQSDSEIMGTGSIHDYISMLGDLRGSYFPRQRPSGGIVLTATNADGRKVREHFDLWISKGRKYDGTNADENALLKFARGNFNALTPLGRRIRALEKEGFKREDIVVEKAQPMPEEVYDVTGLASAINALMDESLQNVKDKSKASPKLESAFAELHKAMATNLANIFKERGGLSSRIRRNPTDYWEGFETDMKKAGVQYARRMAATIAKRQAAQDITLALTGRDISFDEFKAKKLGTKWEEYAEFVNKRKLDPKTQPNLYGEAMSWTKEVLRNDEQVDRIIGTLRGLATLKFLGLRVSSAAVNLTNLLTGVPATISHYSGGSATSAVRQVTRSLKALADYKRGKSSGLDKLVITEIKERGLDVALFNNEAMGVLRSKVGNAGAFVSDKMMGMFGFTERINRGATIHAAYMELHRKHPDMTHAQLMEKAEIASNRAHGLYGDLTAPMWTRGSGNPLRMTFTFMKFSQNYMMNMGDMVRKKDYKNAAYLLLSPAILGGLGASAATPVIMWIARALGMGDDPEEELYTWAAEVFGSDTVMRHGLPGLVGLNFKGSLAINNPVPTTIEELFGAPGSLFFDIRDAVRETRRGAYGKAAEKFFPTGLVAPFKALREYDEGVTTGSYSRVHYGNEPLKATGYDAVLRAFSFNPSRISGIREKQWSEDKIARKYRQERTDINTKVKKAWLKGNGKISHADWLELMAEVESYNERVKGLNLPDITPITKKALRLLLRRQGKPNKRERLRTNPNI